MFVIDGLNEFAYLDELIKHKPLNPSSSPIVNALADALDIQRHKCVVAGRVIAVSHYKAKVTECIDKLTIQILGFNDNEINDYIAKYSNKKEAIKNVLSESNIARAMASIPIYLSAMCTVIETLNLINSNSFYTMTELYCCIFLYIFQKHICKSNEPVYLMMQSESNKQNVLRVCKIAWEIVFFEDKTKSIVENCDFVEKVKTQLGYEFNHLTLMEFCASIHAYVHLSPKEITDNKRLHSCLPMICGLTNENERSFVRFLANLKKPRVKKNSKFNAEFGECVKMNKNV